MHKQNLQKSLPNELTNTTIKHTIWPHKTSNMLGFYQWIDRDLPYNKGTLVEICVSFITDMAAYLGAQWNFIIRFS